MTPGYYDSVPLSTYLADPCTEPSLSTSTVEALYYRSPLDAYTHHPRLVGIRGDDSSRADLGSVVHSVLLGGSMIAYGDFPDWRTKASQEFRDSSRAAGVLPLLEKQRGPVEIMVRNAKAALDEKGTGEHEVTMIFQVEGVWCRARPDFLIDGLDVDVKTCTNADPHEFARTQLRGRNEIQAGLRSLGHKALGQERKQVILAVEIEQPYDCSFIGLAPSAIALAEQKVIWAAKLWRKCLDSGKFPGYGTEIHWAEAPSYGEQELAERTGILP